MATIRDEAIHAGVATRHYVPFLKGKQGERLAVRSLDPSVKGAITPAFQLIAGRSAETLEREMRQLADGWTGFGPVLIDAAWLDPAATRLHPLRLVGDLGTRLRIPVIPVISPASDAGYRAAARAVIGTHHYGAAIRLPAASWLPDLAKPVIDDLLSDGLQPAETDLLLDAEAIANDAALNLHTALRDRSLSGLPYLTDWRRVILMGGSFPTDLTGIQTGSVVRLPRREWVLWSGIVSPRRDIGYGDYGVAHPQTADEITTPRAIPVYPQLRYTTTDTFAVTKGRDLRRNGDGELYDVCRRVRALPDVDPATFSPGDRWIAARSGGSGSVGNYSTWRRIGTSHHVTKIVALLASRSAP